MTIGSSLINRPMLNSDVGWVAQHSLTNSLREFVDYCAERDIPFWNGRLQANTFNSSIHRWKGLNQYRLWEYISCHDLFVKKYPPGAHFIDLGGAGCYFSYFLASIGYRITIVDSNPYLVDVSNAIARNLSLENKITALCKDITVGDRLDIDDVDGLYSISVIEHIQESARFDAYCSLYEAVKEKEGYIFLTFDYGQYSYGSINPVSSLSEFAAGLEAAGLVVVGNSYSKEMEGLRIKPGGLHFDAVNSRIRVMSPTDPLMLQLKFFVVSAALRIGASQVKLMMKNLLGRRYRGYNFGRLLLQTKVAQ